MRNFLLALALFTPAVSYAADFPLFDAHIHYSEEAWQRIPPKEAIALLRKAGVKRALVSSTNDDGNQKLFAEAPDLILPSLRTYLAFRNDHGSVGNNGGRLDPDWKAAFMEFPERFLVGTDTYTAERWHYVLEHANWSRGWMADLPREVAEKIAYKNGDTLFAGAMK